MVSQNLVGIALQQLIPGALSMARLATVAADGGQVAEGIAGHALRFLESRVSDHSARLLTAIQVSTDRAWRALELVLAGDSFWDRLKGKLAAGDMKAFRHDVRGLLAAAGVDGAYPVDYRAAARELRAARSAGLLQPAGLTPAGMVQSIGVFGRFDNPAELAAGQWRAAEAIAADLKSRGYPALAAVAGFRPTPDCLPLLGIAVRYFFRKAVEADVALAQGLSFARQESLAETEEQHFDALNRAFNEQADRLEETLTELAAEVAEVKAAALDIRAEQERLGDQNRDLMEAVLQIQTQLDQVGRAALRPQDSLSVRTEDERALVKQVIAQYRRLPEVERRGRPALRNAVGLLEVAAGDFAAAQADFAAVAGSVADPTVQGAAHMNAYQAALETRDWPAALHELLAAIQSDSRRYAPFPVDKFTPIRILGAGGFGVAFLCKHRYLDALVVVKSLGGLGHHRDFEAVFNEARAATAIQHKRIVRVTDCGFTEPARKERPFMVMDYFPGESLDAYVRASGALTVEAALPFARKLAEALGAAHARRILHRDVKPGNILVASVDGVIDVRVIDFGLAVQHRIAGDKASITRTGKTLVGESLAGTIDYAAPEQMGRIAGANVGPASDIYGWAKTCCFALFQTPQPTLRHWRCLPARLADLLSRCLEEYPQKRPQSFDGIVEALDRFGPRGETSRTVNLCWCGCKGTTKSRFVPGHDARFHGAAKKVARGLFTEKEVGEALDQMPHEEAREEFAVHVDRERTRLASEPRSASRNKLKPVTRTRGEAEESIRVRERIDRANRPDGDRPEKKGLGVLVWVCILVAVGAAVAAGVLILILALASTNLSNNGNNTKSQAPFNVPGIGSWGQGTEPWPGGAPVSRPGLPAGWKETKDLGGGFGHDEYREVKEDGSYLIGFEVGLGKWVNIDVIGYLRSIWKTPSGERFGNGYGNRPSALWTVKAKEGYALGGAVARGGGMLDGICFTFFKKNEKSLDPNDSYVTDWYGNPAYRPPSNEMRAGDGSLLVGIHGKLFSQEMDRGGICTIGFVMVAKQ